LQGNSANQNRTFIQTTIKRVDDVNKYGIEFLNEKGKKENNE
jgi:hypothetical protein